MSKTKSIAVAFFVLAVILGISIFFTTFLRVVPEPDIGLHRMVYYVSALFLFVGLVLTGKYIVNWTFSRILPD